MTVRTFHAFVVIAFACRGSAEQRPESNAGGSWDETAERGFAIWDSANVRNEETARGLFRDACDHGSQLGCAGLGEIALSERSPAPGLALLTAACDASVARACAALAADYEVGAHVHRDGTKAVAFARRACDGRDQHGCVIYARAMLFGEHGVPRDPASARQIATEACPRIPAGCTLVGLAESREFNNAMEAHKWLRRGCDAGDGAGCAAAAYQALNGGIAREAKGVPIDVKLGIALATRACDLETPIGCALLARVLDEGIGIARDRVRAAQLAARACSADEPAGCVIAANIAAHEGKQADADAYRARSCTLGNRAACAR